MPRKAMRCIVEIDLHVVTCPGTFLRDYEYVYLHMEMLGLEARTKSVPPTFPLFFHERLKFERTFYDCTDPALVAALLKGEDIIIELRQHTDYITDGRVIAHCSSNTHDFIYPAIPPYYGSGREIVLYKTSKFKPIRVTGEQVKLEFTTTTIIKEVPEFDTLPRRSISPTRTAISKSPRRTHGSKSVEAVPNYKYDRTVLSSTPAVNGHVRSKTAPTQYLSPVRNLRHAFDDLTLQSSFRRRTRTASPHLGAALDSSFRIQRRVDDVIRKRDRSLDSDNESDYSLDVLRDSLREERNALNDAIREADREAYYRSLNRSLRL